MNSAFNSKKIILISSERGEVQKLLGSFRKNSIATGDIFWLKDLQQVVDYLCSTGRYAGKKPDAGPKIFVLDYNFDGYEDIVDLITYSDHLKGSPILDFSVAEKEVLSFMELRRPYNFPGRERVLFGFYHRY